jgi:hypothetical protein
MRNFFAPHAQQIMDGGRSVIHAPKIYRRASLKFHLFVMFNNYRGRVLENGIL